MGYPMLSIPYFRQGKALAKIPFRAYNRSNATKRGMILIFYYIEGVLGFDKEK